MTGKDQDDEMKRVYSVHYHKSYRFIYNHFYERHVDLTHFQLSETTEISNLHKLSTGSQVSLAAVGHEAGRLVEALV
jgi:uncharacterized protein YtpQ (UPF0354 family)